MTSFESNDSADTEGPPADESDDSSEGGRTRFAVAAVGGLAVAALGAVTAVAATDLLRPGAESPGASVPDLAEERPESDDEPALSVDAPNAVDLGGAWAVRTVQTALTKVPMAGEVEATTTTIYSAEMRQDGDRVTLAADVCDTTIDSSFDRLDTVVPEAFVRTIPRRERSGSLRVEEGKLHFELPRSCRVRGAAVDDPADAPLPSTPDDAAVVDADDDGHPGVTIRVEGMIEGELYMAQRSCDRYAGRVVDRDRIEGRLEWQSDRSVLDSTHMLLGGQTGSKPHPDEAKSHFTMRRLEVDDADCSDALEAF